MDKIKLWVGVGLLLLSWFGINVLNPPHVYERCANGIDDDGNGLIDESCAQFPSGRWYYTGPTYTRYWFFLPEAGARYNYFLVGLLGVFLIAWYKFIDS